MVSLTLLKLLRYYCSYEMLDNGYTPRIHQYRCTNIDHPLTMESRQLMAEFSSNDSLAPQLLGLGGSLLVLSIILLCARLWSRRRSFKADDWTLLAGAVLYPATLQVQYSLTLPRFSPFPTILYYASPVPAASGSAPNSLPYPTASPSFASSSSTKLSGIGHLRSSNSPSRFCSYDSSPVAHGASSFTAS
jgi:hypothetical protein